jgi:hypothetical protein
MKTLTVKVPELLAAEIEAEARSTGTSKSDVVRRRLERGREGGGPHSITMWDLTHDLIEKLERENSDPRPRNVAGRKKYYLRKWAFGKNKPTSP